ncbi:MAG: TIGR03545 family protein [Nitrospina sp.]|nr:MAG: TIGR03545 family protein [Nitrospina sp.]
MKQAFKLGLGVVIVITAVISGFLLFFMDGLIQNTIEEKGSEILEAQVDIGSLVTSLSKQSIEIRSIQIADANNLENNLIEVGTLVVDFDLIQAFSKKIILDELIADGIHFNKKRTSPAKPFKPIEKSGPKEAPEGDGFSFLPGMPAGLNLKSPEDILKSEKLETLEAVEKTRLKIKNLQKDWEAKLDKALGKAGIEKIKERIDSIKNKARNISGLKSLGTIQSLAAEIQSIRTDIKSQLNQIKSLKDDLKNEIARTKKLVADLKNLPKKDWDRLKKKYSLSSQDGGVNLVSSLVTGPLKKKLDRAWSLYKQVSPYLNNDSDDKPDQEEVARNKEQTTQLSQSAPTPNFLLRHALLGISILNQEVSGDLWDFSDNQKLHGKPAVLKLDASKNENFDRFILDLTLDRTGSAAQDTLEVALQSFQLNDLDLGGSVAITRGEASVKGNVEILGENDLSGKFRLDIKNVSFNYPVKPGDEFSKIAGQVLAAVENLYIAVQITGTLDNYSIQIESDLDQLLNRALRKVFDAKIKEFESRLKKSIAKATAGPLSETNNSLSGLLNLGKRLNANEASYKDLLGKATKSSLLGGTTKSVPLNKLKDQLKGFKLPF